jgi:hypothetical protein
MRVKIRYSMRVKIRYRVNKEDNSWNTNKKYSIKDSPVN